MILITSVTLFLSLLAVSVAIGAWLATRRGSEASLLRRYGLLSARLESCETLIEKLSAEIRNVRAARYMAAGRAREQSELANGPLTYSEEEKARIRKELGAKLARGELSTLSSKE